MNRLPQHARGRDELIPFDPLRHALASRIELAKERLFADLDEAQRQLRQAATSAVQRVKHSVTRTALVGGALLLGLVVALALRRRKRHLRIVWR